MKKEKKRIVLIGAFDRYNYGDNLMPIMFEMFMKKYYPDFLKQISLEFCALTKSDLSMFGAYRTEPISSLLNDKESISAIISVGGEVLGSSSSTLFLHMNHPIFVRKVVRRLKKNKYGMILADFLCRKYYGLGWEYPYIPSQLNSNCKIILNTIGGEVSRFKKLDKFYNLPNRLKVASYVSVRDARTSKSLGGLCNPLLSPDSVIIMRDVVSEAFLQSKVSNNISSICSTEYLCFQAAPEKAGESAEFYASVLQKISKKYNIKVVLCPIGYAEGHDDQQFLSKIKEHNSNFDLITNLNIWEIMSVIKNSKIFIGTSLHGVITAMSYSVPYIGLNPSIVKMDKFLSEWAVNEANRCFYPDELLESIDNVIHLRKEVLKESSDRLIKLALENNERIANLLLR